MPEICNRSPVGGVGGVQRYTEYCNGHTSPSPLNMLIMLTHESKYGCYVASFSAVIWPSSTPSTSSAPAWYSSRPDPRSKSAGAWRRRPRSGRLKTAGRDATRHDGRGDRKRSVWCLEGAGQIPKDPAPSSRSDDQRPVFSFVAQSFSRVLFGSTRLIISDA